MASKEVKYGSKIYSISYEIANLKCSQTVVFLHGWGANKEIMKKAFCGILSDFKHVYIDMPGFGASDIFTPLYTKDYAKILEIFFHELKIEPKIIFGHSFGGKVATLIKPEILVLLSSAGIVVPKPFLIRAKIAIFKFFKFLGFGFLYKFFATNDVKGMSKTMYETLKNVVDEDFSYKFANFKGRAFIFWGADDKTTPLRSGEQINSLIANSELHPLRGDHFFFLLHSKYIEGVLISGIKNGLNSNFEREVGEVKVIKKNIQTSEICSNLGDKNIKKKEPCLFDKIAQINDEPVNEPKANVIKHKKEPKIHKIPKQQVFDL
ncbi:MAG: alpha/beta fold hydrolase [Campylobacter sp.]